MTDKMADTKRCIDCGVIKSTENFNKHKASRDGLRYKCKVCSKAYGAANYKKVDEHRAKLKCGAGGCFQCKVATIALDFAHWPECAKEEHKIRQAKELEPTRKHQTRQRRDAKRPLFMF